MADIFLNAGLSYDNSLASSAIVSLTQVFGTGCSIFLVERVGRKPLLLASSSGMAISIGALGAFFYLDDHQEIDCIEANFTSTTATTIWSTTEVATTTLCIPQDGFSEELIDSLGWLPLVD